MNTHPYTEQDITLYLEGNMDKVESKAFEEELRANPSLSERVAIIQLEHRAAEIFMAEDLKVQMDLWEKGEPFSASEPKIKKPLPITYLWSGVAAAVILFLALFYLGIFNRQASTTLALARDFHAQSNPFGETRSGNSPVSVLEKEKAKLSNYLIDTTGLSASRVYFDNLEANNTNIDPIERKMILANLSFRAAKYQEAKIAFEEISLDADLVKDTRQKAEFYAFLSDVALGKNGQEFKADIWVRFSPPHNYSDQVNELLKYLK